MVSLSDPAMTPAPPRMGRGSTATVAVIVLLATFVSGALLGIVADRVWMFTHGPRMPHPPASFLVDRLDRRLHFTADQRKEVLLIIERRQARIGQVWASVHPQVRQEVEQTNAEIERVLTPEQRAEFAKIRMKLTPRRDGRGIRFRHD
jgi:hypothetical protein